MQPRVIARPVCCAHSDCSRRQASHIASLRKLLTTSAQITRNCRLMCCAVQRGGHAAAAAAPAARAAHGNRGGDAGVSGGCKSQAAPPAHRLRKHTGHRTWRGDRNLVQCGSRAAAAAEKEVGRRRHAQLCCGIMSRTLLECGGIPGRDHTAAVVYLARVGCAHLSRSIC